MSDEQGGSTIPIGATLAEADARPAGPSFQVERTVVESVPASALSRAQATTVAEALRKQYADNPAVWHLDKGFAERYATAVSLAAGHTFEEGAESLGELAPAGGLLPPGSGQARVELAFQALPAAPPGQRGWDRQTHADLVGAADDMQMPPDDIREAYDLATQARARAGSGQGPDAETWTRPLAERWGDDQVDGKLEEAAFALEVLLHHPKPRVAGVAKEIHALWGWEPRLVIHLADKVYRRLKDGNLGADLVTAINRRALSLKARDDRARAEGAQIREREAHERDEALREAQQRIVAQHSAWGELTNRRPVR